VEYVIGVKGVEINAEDSGQSFSRRQGQAGLKEIAVSYLKISLLSFGGGLSAWAQLVIVDKRQWLTDEEFLSAMALCRILPGPNQINFAVYVGLRLRGLAGVTAALAGLIIVPFFLVLLMGIAYFHFQSISSVYLAIGGMASVAVGMTLGAGVKLLLRYSFTYWTMIVMLASFIAIGILRWPLLPVLAILIPISVGLSWTRVVEPNEGINDDE
jgi:chromate transporter